MERLDFKLFYFQDIRCSILSTYFKVDFINLIRKMAGGDMSSSLNRTKDS